MQQGLALIDLARKLREEKSQKKDLIVSTGHTRLVPVNGQMLLEHKDPDSRDTEWAGELNPLAHSQIAEQVNIPLKYYKRMHAETPELLADNVNTWFKREPAGRMLRTMSGKGRAWLSNRYSRIENDLIAEVALKVLSDMGVDLHKQIVSTQVTETKLYIEAVLPNLELEVKGSPRVGDVVRGGVVISNSEVGRGRVDVSEFDYRLWCLNGAVSASLFRKTHTGTHLEDQEDLLADDTKQSLDSALMLQIRDYITAALSPDRFRARINRMSDLARLGITGNASESIKVMSRVLGPTVGLTAREEDSILNSLISQGDGATAYGLFNAVTAQANTSEDYDRAIELQRAGGRLLELSRGDWNEILEADSSD